MKGKGPWNTPLDEWPSGWLTLEVASLLGEPGYIMLHEREKRVKKYPVTDEEKRTFIKQRRV